MRLGRTRFRKTKAIRILILPLVIASSITVFQATPAGAAGMCKKWANRKTVVGGPITAQGGQLDGYYVTAMVGLDMKNAAGQKVDVNGDVVNTSGYTYTDNVNYGKGNKTTPDLVAPPGTPKWQAEWGAQNNGKLLCINERVKTISFEVYSRDKTGQTVITATSGSMDHGVEIVPNEVNTIPIRVPTASTYGGNTGSINGYITKNGQPVPHSEVLHIRAWARSSNCGVHGFAASANYKAESATATYFRIDEVAAGQCNAAHQSYDVYVTLRSTTNPNEPGLQLKKTVDVVAGQNNRKDFNF